MPISVIDQFPLPARRLFAPDSGSAVSHPTPAAPWATAG